MKNLLNTVLMAIKYNKKKIIITKSIKNIFICTKLLNANIIKNFILKNNQIILTLSFHKNKQILPNYDIFKKLLK